MVLGLGVGSRRTVAGPGVGSRRAVAGVGSRRTAAGVGSRRMVAGVGSRRTVVVPGVGSRREIVALATVPLVVTSREEESESLDPEGADSRDNVSLGAQGASETGVIWSAAARVLRPCRAATGGGLSGIGLTPTLSLNRGSANVWMENGRART